MMRLAVIGDPVAHSLSPAYHRAFLAEFELAGSYEAIEVRAGTGAVRIEALRAAGYIGLNVTTPLKEEASARADWHDAVATACGAVNTLVLGARIDGYNTDGIGSLGALAAAGCGDVAGRRILVLGAGATARAATCALVAASARVVVWNRTAAAARRVAADLGAEPWTAGTPFEAAFSTLPPDAVPENPALLAGLRRTPLLIDANYGSRSTLGARLARGDVHDGSAMLRVSARASFEIFRSQGATLRRGGDSNSRDL